MNMLNEARTSTIKYQATRSMSMAWPDLQRLDKRFGRGVFSEDHEGELSVRARLTNDIYVWKQRAWVEDRIRGNYTYLHDRKQR